MSANIPENMRLDDLLKATGYNCPEDLQRKTFDEATSGGGAVLEDNKEVTITENGTTIITPSAGKDGMKKVTANVNVAGGGGDISLTTTTIEGFKTSYGAILCDENGVPLKVDNIATFDLTKIKYIYEGQEYSSELHDMAGVTDLHWDSENYVLEWNDGSNNITLDTLASSELPILGFFKHNFD